MLLTFGASASNVRAVTKGRLIEVKGARVDHERACLAPRLVTASGHAIRGRVVSRVLNDFQGISLRRRATGDQKTSDGLHCQYLLAVEVHTHGGRLRARFTAVIRVIFGALTTIVPRAVIMPRCRDLCLVTVLRCKRRFPYQGPNCFEDGVGRRTVVRPDLNGRKGFLVADNRWLQVVVNLRRFAQVCQGDRSQQDGPAPNDCHARLLCRMTISPVCSIGRASDNCA